MSKSSTRKKDTTDLDKALEENVKRLKEEGLSDYRISRYVGAWKGVDKIREVREKKQNSTAAPKKKASSSMKTIGKQKTRKRKKT